MTMKMRPARFEQRPFEEIALELGPRLVKARKKAHLTQVEVAKRTGVSEGHIRDLERQMRGGRVTDPKLGTLYALCAVYQIDIYDLIPPR